jgi:hypothetical protein
VGIFGAGSETGTYLTVYAGPTIFVVPASRLGDHKVRSAKKPPLRYLRAQRASEMSQLYQISVNEGPINSMKLIRNHEWIPSTICLSEYCLTL